MAKAKPRRELLLVTRLHAEHSALGEAYVSPKRMLRMEASSRAYGIEAAREAVS
jgi:hypothetical protein